MIGLTLFWGMEVVSRLAVNAHRCSVFHAVGRYFDLCGVYCHSDLYILGTQMLRNAEETDILTEKFLLL